MMRVPALAVLAGADLCMTFGLQSFVLAAVGVGGSTDAWYAGQVIPVTLLSIIQLPLQRAVLSTYSDDMHRTQPALVLIAATSLGALGVLALLGLAAPFLFQVLFAGLQPTASELALRVYGVQSLTVCLMLAGIVLLPLNHLRGRFIGCEIANLCGTASSVLFVVLTLPRLGVISAALGTLIRAAVVLALYWAPVVRIARWGPAPWKKLVEFARPLMSASAISKLSPIIDRSLASSAAPGALTTLTFAQNLYTAATQLADRAVIAPALPDLRRGKLDRSPFLVAVGLAFAGVGVALTLSAGTLFLKHMNISVGRLSDEHLGVLATCLALLSGMAIGSLSGQWMSAAAAILGRPGTVARIAIIGFLVSVPIKLMGFAVGGVFGLALAISAYYLLNAMALGVVVYRIRNGYRTS